MPDKTGNSFQIISGFAALYCILPDLIFTNPTGWPGTGSPAGYRYGMYPVPTVYQWPELTFILRSRRKINVSSGHWYYSRTTVIPKPMHKSWKPA